MNKEITIWVSIIILAAVFGVTWQLPFSNGSYTIISYYSITEENEEAILLNKEITQ